MSELGDYKRAEAAWERTLREWRCPDCGMGVTKVHMTIKGLQGCGKPPGYWAGRRGCEHDETLMGGECGCDERPRFVATNGDTIELTDEQAAYVARVLAPTEEAEKNTREWRVRLDSRSTGPIGWLFAVDVALVEPEDAQEDVIVVPKSALTAALEERDEWQRQHGYAMEGQESWRLTAKQNLERAERAEAALAEALDVLDLLVDNQSDEEWHLGCEKGRACLRKHEREPS